MPGATAESQLISARLWLGDRTDGLTKLTDTNPLTAVERYALTQVHDRTTQCRQIVAGDKCYAAWGTPPWREYFQGATPFTTSCLAARSQWVRPTS